MTALTKSDDPRLEYLKGLMDRASALAAFQELDPFGERQGSWQRTMHTFRGGLDRYVLLAITNLEEHNDVSVSAGAEERPDPDSGAARRFRRFDVGTIRLDSEDSSHWPQRDIEKLIDQAIRMALEIESMQLQDRQLLAS